MGKTTVDLIIKEYNEMRTVTVPKKKNGRKNLFWTLSKILTKMQCIRTSIGFGLGVKFLQWTKFIKPFPLMIVCC